MSKRTRDKRGDLPCSVCGAENIHIGCCGYVLCSDCIYRCPGCNEPVGQSDRGKKKVKPAPEREQCRYFNQGRCRFGDRCHFLHGEDDEKDECNHCGWVAGARTKNLDKVEVKGPDGDEFVWTTYMVRSIFLYSVHLLFGSCDTSFLSVCRLLWAGLHFARRLFNHNKAIAEGMVFVVNVKPGPRTSLPDLEHLHGFFVFDQDVLERLAQERSKRKGLVNYGKHQHHERVLGERKLGPNTMWAKDHIPKVGPYPGDTKMELDLKTIRTPGDIMRHFLRAFGKKFKTPYVHGQQNIHFAIRFDRSGNPILSIFSSPEDPCSFGRPPRPPPPPPPPPPSGSGGDSGASFGGEAPNTVR